MKSLTDEDKKLLTEYLGECWDADKRPGGDLPNRTFTSYSDFGDLKDKLMENEEWDKFLGFAFEMSDCPLIVEYDNTFSDFTAWLFRPESCDLVADYLKYKNKNKEN